MAVITVQFASAGLAELTFASANSGGDTVASGTKAGGWGLPVFLIVFNGHSGAQTVTAAGHPPIEIAAGKYAVIPVFSGKGGAVKAVTYSGVTAMTIAAVRL